MGDDRVGDSLVELRISGNQQASNLSKQFSYFARQYFFDFGFIARSLSPSLLGSFSAHMAALLYQPQPRLKYFCTTKQKVVQTQVYFRQKEETTTTMMTKKICNT